MATHPVATAALIASGCCLILIVVGSVSGLALPSTMHDPDLLVVNTTDKGPRIIPGSGIDSACRGQNWGHESRACLAAIRIQAGQRRSIRIIADGGDGSQAQ
ncbi:hypothetical protein RFM41_20910 [Mesorhizobium sp. VK25A]|uniref:Uncharacterized protein n=1 Tax=Mesorhizobium vachelliae TaxID=3072309 RepID=A0ABU5A7D5_9HYPH|nr:MULTISPECIES: hypothetical protein [unclassified Mesorhizobium]MDX8533626.1 hypothetical protein [Mesorhizobium sp. VK25D]MDX8546221.1 hypothetical protein [Mesorhizobium sp. VK25A]